jgi:hypothetical protein
MKAVILVSIWVMFLALTVLTFFSSYRSAAAISLLSPPPLRSFVFAGAVFNALATALLFWQRSDSTARRARAFVLALTFVFWVMACAVVIFFVLSLAGSLSRLG